MELKENTIKVAIRCLTFNHEHFIEDAIKGFVMQQTDFPFVAIVVDDASTDKEPTVLWYFVNRELDSNFIKKEETDDYVQVVAPHKTNSNCIFFILFLKYNYYFIKKNKDVYSKVWHNSAKYIALCEGDDYWIDPLKLQKQVNILEQHPDCSLGLSNVFPVKTLDKNAKVINPYLEQRTGFISMHTLLLSIGGLVPTASMCYK